MLVFSKFDIISCNLRLDQNASSSSMKDSLPLYAEAENKVDEQQLW